MRLAQRVGAIPKRGNKFHAKKSRLPGGLRLYDSGAERDRAQELKLLERARAIRELEEQPCVQLTRYHDYRPDFAYKRKGETVFVFEDVKGADTERFIINCRLWRERGPAELHITKRQGKASRFYAGKTIVPDTVDPTMYEPRRK